MDIFTWSMPFVIEKVTEMLFYILQPPTNPGSTDNDVVSMPSLPPAVEKVYRESLSKEQNEAVALAQSLAMHMGGTAPAAGGSSGSGGPKPEGEEENARERMRRKVKTVARMARMFKTLRQENETVVRLKGVCPGHKLAPGLLLTGKAGLHSELELFGHAQGLDAENEVRPSEAPPEGGGTYRPTAPVQPENSDGETA